MSWLNRKKREIAAVYVEPTRVHAVQVSRMRGARPTVTFSRTDEHDGDAAAVLARIKAELGLQQYRCTTVMAPGTSRLLVIESPKVAPEEMREAVRWRLTEMLDYPPEQAVVDTLPIVVDMSGRPHPTSIHVVAAQKGLVEQCAESLRSAGLPLSSIDIPELAMRNVAALFSDRTSGIALAWFQPSGSGIVFVAGTELCVVRQFDPTAADAAEALVTKDARMLERIELGLQRSLDHFERNFSGVPINRLLLAPFAGAGALAEHLSSHLSVPVEVADLEKALDFSAAPDLADPARANEMLVPLGAALRSD
jgi:MSHA biogenesis protein MshI